MANITSYLKAGQPGLIMKTSEIERAINQTKVECKFRKLSWDLHRGIIDVEAAEVIDNEVLDPIALCEWLSENNDTVIFAQMFHKFFEDVQIIQAVLNNLNAWKACGSCLCLIGPDIKVPSEVEPFFLSVDFELPDINELMAIQTDLGSQHNIKASMAAAEAARGLTEFEAETAFALSVIKTKGKLFDPEIIIEQKKQIIKKSGLMEFYPPVDISEVGGLKPMKDFFANRAKAYEPESKLPKPKGVLLVGIAGTGKSLSCKAVANILNWPLIRLDISSLKGSLVGQSEANVNKAIAVIEAFGRAVVWWDEIEKALSGAKSSSQTGDTSESMLGLLLTWMSETTSEVLIMASANEIENLPSAFKRAGRFDAIFFVDLPSENEIAEIQQIMDTRYGSTISEIHPKKLKGFTGAEIEQLAKDSLFDGIETALQNIIPISVSQKEEIASLQAWAKQRARRANEAEVKTVGKKVRRISK